MGLRELAEKLISEEDARRAADKEWLIARVAVIAPEALAQWSATLGLEQVPEYTRTDISYAVEGPSAATELTFEADGFAFTGGLRVYQDRHKFFVRMTDTSQSDIRTVADVAEGLRELEGRWRIG